MAHTISLDRLANPTLGTLIELATSYEESYRRSLRSAVRGLWKGELDYDLFFDAMLSAIQMFLPKAGYEGAAEVGVSPADLSPEEKTVIQQTTSQETNYIHGLAEAVEQNVEVGGKLGTLFNRVELWVKRYNDLKNRIKMIAGGDQKLEWVLNPAKENCPSCQKLNGQVRRASYWKRVDVRPQHPTKLECMISAGGPSVCGCEFVPTNEPCSRGPLPALP